MIDVLKAVPLHGCTPAFDKNIVEPEQQLRLGAATNNIAQMDYPPDIQTVRIKPDRKQTIANVILQTVGIALATIFGAWSVLGWQEAKQSNAQSFVANTLAFASFCAGLPESGVCSNSLTIRQHHEADEHHTTCTGTILKALRSGQRHTSRVCHINHCLPFWRYGLTNSNYQRYSCSEQ